MNEKKIWHQFTAAQNITYKNTMDFVNKVKDVIMETGETMVS